MYSFFTVEIVWFIPLSLAKFNLQYNDSLNSTKKGLYQAYQPKQNSQEHCIKLNLNFTDKYRAIDSKSKRKFLLKTAEKCNAQQEKYIYKKIITCEIQRKYHFLTIKTICNICKLDQATHPRSGSRAAAIPKMECFVIIVNG